MSDNQDILDKIVEDVKNNDATPAPVDTPVASTPATEAAGDSMHALLAQEEVSFPEVDEVYTGIVIDIAANTVYVDLGPIGTGVVFGKEAKSGLSGDEKLKPGDEISGIVVERENEDGYVELSIRAASIERAWEDLKEKMDAQAVLPTKILDANRGGLMIEMNGVRGFLPVSQLSNKHYPRVDDGDKNKILELLKRLVGVDIAVRVIAVDREEEKLIVSEKAALSEQEREAIGKLSKGDVIEGEVSGVVDFGAFVKFLPAGAAVSEEDNRLEGLVHISELAWRLIDNPRELIKVGDKVQAKIIGIDKTRISLSIRALQQDPWDVVQQKYAIGETYVGTVDKINHFGAFVYLDEDIHGLAHSSEFQEAHPGKKLENTIKSGNAYKWKVLSIQPKAHRMGLVLVDDTVMNAPSTSDADTPAADDTATAE